MSKCMSSMGSAEGPYQCDLPEGHPTDFPWDHHYINVNNGREYWGKKRPTILSCPFCGAAPITEKVYGMDDHKRVEGLLIQCVGDRCLNPSVSYIPPASAVALWNQRSE